KETASYANGEGYDSSAATAVTSTLTRRDRGNDAVPNDIIAPLPEDVNSNTQLPMDDIGPVRETFDEDIGPVKDGVGSDTKGMYVDAKRKEPLI
ncbi:MAG: hypothetical protein IJO00_02625, partial [Clostridia bacterium]|nr:hypothetical protein [Clostridia bacterium]